MLPKVVCSHCEAESEIEAEKCWKCKRPLSNEAREKALSVAKAAEIAAAEAARIAGLGEAEKRQMAERAFVNGNYKEIDYALLNEFSERVVVSTSPVIYGRDVECIVDVVTAECAFGMNAFKDIFMGFTDFFGGRSKTAQKAFRDARNICLNELRKEALLAGGNAIVSVSLTYNELSGQGKGMLFLVATGTAVKLKPLSI